MKYLTLDEQKQLVKTVREIKSSERDYVIIELLLNTGLRASELVAVIVADVRGKKRLYVRPEDMKNGRGRFIPLNVGIQDILRKWLARKMDTLHESIEDQAPLFMTRSGMRMTKRSLQHLVEKWCIKAGLTTTENGKTVALFTTHSLRHTFAKNWITRGGRLTTLKEVLGHESLASTGVYIEASEREIEEDANLASVSQTRAKRLLKAL